MAGVAALALLGGCDDTDDPASTTTTEAQRPEGFPKEYSGEFFQTVENDGLPAGVEISEDAFVVDTLMTSDDGRGAYLALTPGAPPPAEAEGGTGTIECGGREVEGKFLSEGPGGTGLMRIEGLGAAELTIEENRAAFDSPEAAPLCTEHEGTWTGRYGELEGKSGTFVAYGNHDDKAEVYEAFLTLTEA